MLGLMVIAVAEAQTVYRYVDENGVPTYSERRPEPGTARRLSVIDAACLADNTGRCRLRRDPSGLNLRHWRNTPLDWASFRAEIRQALREHQIDEALVRAVIHAESHFDPVVVSRAGAQGLMQLMPVTQEIYGVSNPFYPEQNIRAGVAHLAYLMRRFDYDRERVLAAYNAGEGAVRRHGGVPPYEETENYVLRVETLFQRYQSSRPALGTSIGSP
jgi:hypothetical protein